MLKNISSLGNSLSKKQQQNIQGGDAFCKGGCVGKNGGDSCYTNSGSCRLAKPGICGNSGGSLTCIPL
ncbi:hypothetical protein ACFO3O_04225 [Dokdonia ponticola]|uniref:Bacteriocin n=1 Tax=Dokdonia ponticola TaxID=2041041 RepID=A0ABV9HSG6_9FLAO